MAKVYDRKKPRLTITVDQDVIDVFDDMRKYAGTNVSGLLNAMIREAMPMFRHMIEAHKQSRANDPEVLQLVRDSVRKASQNAQKQAQEFEKTLDTAETQGKCSECGRTGLMEPGRDICHPCRMVHKQHGNK